MKWLIQLTFQTYTKEYLIVKAKAEALTMLSFSLSVCPIITLRTARLCLIQIFNKKNTEAD